MKVTLLVLNLYLCNLHTYLNTVPRVHNPAMRQGCEKTPRGPPLMHVLLLGLEAMLSTGSCLSNAASAHAQPSPGLADLLITASLAGNLDCCLTPGFHQCTSSALLLQL